MPAKPSFLSRAGGAVVLLFVLSGWILALPQQTRSTPTPAAGSSHMSDAEVDATREQLIKLLRMSPRLTAVVGRDPSLLANQDYISRNNPELAQFLQEHPEIARNPEFYLFVHAPGGRHSGPAGQSLEQFVWPEMNQPWRPDPWDRLGSLVIPFLVFLVLLSAALWLLRVLLENRRWNRILKLQTEVHGKLLDKFGSNQELLTYMNTDAGKRFLEAAPIPVGMEPGSPARMSFTRVLLPLQLGVVLTMVGMGFLMVRAGVPAESQAPMWALGILGMMLGVGFIISAGLAYWLAKRLDLLPQKISGLEPVVPKEQL
jgi:hypothetical protein